MRTVLVWALLVVMPFTGTRVICADAEAAASAKPAMTQDAIEECKRICALHRPPPAPSEEDCALTVDGSSLIMVPGIAVGPSMAAPVLPVVGARAFIEAPASYVEPGLALLSPPPKAPARS